MSWFKLKAILNSLSDEQQKECVSCRTLEELMQFFEKTGRPVTEEEAEAFLAVFYPYSSEEELDDDLLESVRGGGTLFNPVVRTPPVGPDGNYL